ncbi:MAG: succinate dehydrogenase cytochrome b subunit [Bdellovibrionota bacterium]
MLPLKKLFTSSVGKKLLMALTGFGLVFFVVAHLLGNLPLYTNNAEAFNVYTESMENLGWILNVLELGLLATVIVHVAVAIRLRLLNRAARGPQQYAMLRSKGGPSKSNASSRYMIVSGVVLLGFLVLHILQFKYGPSIKDGYVAVVQDRELRDMHRLVFETFKNPFFAALYAGVMLFLGLHVRHGFWSALQSTSVGYAGLSRPLYKTGLVLAMFLTLGFFLMPIIIYFDLYKVFT